LPAVSAAGQMAAKALVRLFCCCCLTKYFLCGGNYPGLFLNDHFCELI
jgi:hypothetical protein